MPEKDQIKLAIQIRTIENKFLELFSEGKLNGTVHTSVGQEFSAIAFAGQLQTSDFVFSNHRCHAHYLAFTGDVRGLIAELLGKETGTSGGVGSSQHLKRGNFFSNGVQGGIVPIAAGLALASKLRKSTDIAVVFIGDGTLGEGVLYETLNLISLWKLPLLVVCENNQYAQSTPVESNLAGGILERARAFGIEAFESSTDSVGDLLIEARASIEHVRRNRLPAFHIVNTYRLNAHSKGDDDRDPHEIARHREKDFLVRFESEEPDIYSALQAEASSTVARHVDDVEQDSALSFDAYFPSPALVNSELTWNTLRDTSQRQITLINEFFRNWLREDTRNIFLGEDVLSPYGGAFKVANGLSDEFPGQVLSTPISEAAITGIANGLALSGFRPAVEIMFGDFVTLALDQIINHASKFFHMYNHQISCPIVLRTPMGGGRGYGPTHSQTLDRFLIGIDNVTTVALNTLVNPVQIYSAVFNLEHPAIVIENKIDYGKVVGQPAIAGFSSFSTDDPFPVVRISPDNSISNLTIVTYGGMTSTVLDCLPILFKQCDLTSEVVVLSCINPIDYRAIIESVTKTRRLVVIEEGSVVGGVSSQVVSSVVESSNLHIETLKIGALPVPIPSPQSLESQVLPSVSRIVEMIGEKFQ